VYGIGGPGSGSGNEESALEVVIRGPGIGSDGKRRGTERTIEGWSAAKGPCSLTELESLRSIWTRSSDENASPFSHGLLHVLIDAYRQLLLQTRLKIFRLI
jgi:hypothetical protein